MSFYDAIRVGASGAADFEIERSLRFDPNDTYMERTPSSAGNRRTFTISLWFKLGIVQEYTGSDGRTLFGSGGGGAGSSATNISLLADAYGGPRLDFLSMLGAASGSNYIRLTTNAFIRDPSAWYHVVVRVDTPQGNSPNRAKMYINGDEVSDWYNYDQPDQNADTYMNVTDKHGVGANRVWSNQNNKYNYFGGYIAEFHFLDGTAYDASYFGETDSTTGQWIPKKYQGGNYGTNGFYLKFADNSGTTATTLGKDSSGNSNNYTPYGFSVAAGVGNDSLEDTPTNNFATLNSLKKPTNGALSNGNLDGSGNASSWVSFFSTIYVSSGKWFCEVKVNATRVGVGIGKNVVNGADENSYLGSAADTYAYFDLNGKWNNNSNSSYGATYTTNDIIGMALDMDAGTLIFYKNGVSQGTAFTGLSGEFALGFSVYGGSASASINFGQRAFDYTVPTGYKALNSANLPNPSIPFPNKHFDTLLYTGNDGSQSITGLNFQPDWAWIKERSGAYHHSLTDSVRGVLKTLSSSRVDIAEYSESSGLNQFLSNGLGFNGRGYFFVNRDTQTYAAWNWNAGNTDSATYTVKVVSDSGNKYRFNDFGTSAVTLDLAEGGTYTFDQSDSSMSSHPMQLSTTANGTHGGGSAYSTGVTYQLDGSTVTASAFISGFSSASSRKLIITVAASAPTLYYYCYYHSGMGGQANTNSTLGSSNFDGTLQATVKANTTAGFSIITWTGNQTSGATLGHGLGVAPKTLFVKRRDGASNWICPLFDEQKAGQLNSATQFTNSYYNVFFPSQPSSTTVTIGSNDDINRNTSTYVAYVFSEVEGYSKIGRYYGNGSSDGVFVFTGFKVAFLLVKRMTGSGNGWTIIDNKRDVDNSVKQQLYPHSSLAEASYDGVDFLANGFKMRQTNAWLNGATDYYYLAFAESPFKNSRAR